MEKVFMTMVSNLLTRIPPLFVDLASILEGEIDCSHTTLTKYSNDGSPYFVFPQAVIFPKNVTDIKHALSFAREYTMPITVRGNGTACTGGALGEGIIIDMTRYFTHIRNINMLENTITVDAGVSVASLLEKLHSWHYDIPLVASVDNDATVGALVATKSANPNSFNHGTIREWIEGLTVVVDTGEEHNLSDGITPSGRLLAIYQEVFPFLTKENPILRANKSDLHDDATGYNIWNTSIGPRQLIDELVGSEGTLGIITSITFRISPHKKHSTTTCIPIIKKELLSTCVDIAKHHKAESISLYDEGFMQLAERYHPALVPSFTDTAYVLLVTHTAHDKEKLHHTVSNFRSSLPVEDYLLKTLHGTSTLSRITETSFLLSLFDSYTNKTQIAITTGGGMIVPLHDIQFFLEDVEEYLNSLGRLYIITGNIGSGHISVSTLFDPRSKNYDEDLFHYTQSLFSLVKNYKGGISAVSGEGLARTPYLSYIYNDAMLSLFKKIKNIWDPLSILNPGKKGDVSTHYLQQHLKRPERG